MADAVDVQSLFLQVDASVELLRRNLASGEQPLSQFEQRAIKMTQSVEKSIGEMGKNFPAFGKMAESAAQQAQRSFNDSFTQIQKMAATAIQAPTVKGGGLNLGAAEARQAADAARQQAQALGLIERAARSAAAGEGVMTQETRLYLQAASAARLEAERHAAELTREAGALERLEIETRAAAAGHQVLVSGQRSVIVSAAQQRQATMMLGQQTQDFAVQVMSGQSVLIAFSQQIGQAAFAVQGMGGKLAAVGEFLGSGWGAAVIVATTVLVPLVGKMLEHNNALEEAVAKLKKDAEETAIADKAHAAFTNTLEGQIAAQKKLNDEMERGLKSQAQINRENLRTSESRVRKSQEDLARLERALQAAEQSLRNVEMSAPGVMSSSANAAYASRLADARARVSAARNARDQAQVSLASSQQGVRDARVVIAASEARAAVDPIAAINKRFDDMADSARAAATANDQLSKSIDGTLQSIEKQRAAALKVEQDRQAAEKRTASDARNGSLTPSRVGSLLTGEFGGTITSTTGGKHVPNSYHYRAQAVDFVPRGGMGSVSKDQIRAYLESQGVNIKELLGPGDKGHNDHFHVAFSKTSRSQDEISRRAETAQNQILADQISYAEQVRQARRRLLDAQGRTADTAEEQDRLAREEVKADYTAQRDKIAAQLARKDLKPDEATNLNSLNEQTRDQRLRNITTERATEKIAAGFDAAAQGADIQIAMLRIQGDMAQTLSDRRRIALQLLTLEQEQEKRALERTLWTSQDPNEVARAQSALRALPKRQAEERAQTEQRYAGPMDQYRSQLQAATGDMNTALEGVAVNGLENLQNGLTGIISGTESVGSAFKRMASSIVADLARIAIEKLILSSIGGGGSFLSAFGLAGGGKVEGRASGGKVSGPGTGTSDSILAMLGAKPIMLSNGESIVTAEATAKFWPVIDAMNKGKMKQFASGGLVSGLPALPTLSAPRLPALGRQGYGSRGTAETLLVKVDKSPYFDVEVQRVAAPMSQMAAIGGSEMAQQELAERQAQVLS